MAKEALILNSYQKAAVENLSRACLVNACVGSGKTTVLTQKVRWLHEKQGISYERMMVLTFTNRAAGEILERLALSEESELAFGTFHSVAANHLRKDPALSEYGRTQDFEILDREEELALARELIESHKLKVKYPNRLPRRLESERIAWQTGGKPRYKDDLFLLFSLMEEEKQARNRMTFTDLLEIWEQVLRRQKEEGSLVYPDWLIIDEVQDCNRAQIELLKLLYGPGTHLFAVGDPNQMIYSFRGGDETLFYHIKNYFEAEELSLPINYRSSPDILAIANRFRQYGTRITGQDAQSNAQQPASEQPGSDPKGQPGNVIAPEFAAPEDPAKSGGPGTKVPLREYYDPFLEAEILAEKIQKLHEEGVSYSQIAILYRLKEQSAQLEGTFGRYQIPFEVRLSSGGSLFGQPELPQFCLRQKEAGEGTKNPAEIAVSSVRKLNPDAGTGRDGNAAGEPDSVHLMTLHASKGLEFDYVFLIGLNAGLVPLTTKDYDQKAEEQRLFFVGLTRAKRHLELSWYTNPTQHQSIGEMSPFLRMIPEKLLDMEKPRSESEKRQNLQSLRKEVQEEIRLRSRTEKGKGSNPLESEPGNDKAPAALESRLEEESERNSSIEKTTYALHPKYGKGIVKSQDEMTIRVEFPGYGEKEFLTMFGEVTLLNENA